MAQNGEQQANPMVPWVIWGALFMSLFIYLGVLFVITGQPANAQDTDPELISTLQLSFGGISVVIIAGLFVYRKVTFFDKLDQGDVFESLSAVRKRYLTVCIISWALSEAVGIYGFVLSVLTHEIHYYVIFLVPAALLYVVFRPQTEQVEKRYEESQPEEATATVDDGGERAATDGFDEPGGGAQW